MFKVECKNLIEFDIINKNGRIWSKECIERAMGSFPIYNVRIGYYVEEACHNFGPDEYMTDSLFNESKYVQLGFGDLVYNEERNSVDLVNGIVQYVPGIDPVARNTLNHCSILCTCDVCSHTPEGHHFEAVTGIRKNSLEVYLCRNSGFSNEQTTIEKIDDKGNDALEAVKQYCIEQFQVVHDKRSNVQYKLDNHITETGERADEEECELMWGDERMFDGELVVYQNIISYINSLQCNGIDDKVECTTTNVTNELNDKYNRAVKDAEWYKYRMKQYRESLFYVVDLIRTLKDKLPKHLSELVEAEIKRY